MRVALGPTPTLIFFLVLMSLTDIWRIWRITPHFVSVFVILFGIGLFGLLYKRWQGPMFAIVYAAIFGAVFNFFDFLVNPPMAPMLLAFLVLTIEFPAPQGAPLKAYRQALVFAGFVAGSWFCGYGLTWLSKWAIAAAWQTDGMDSVREIFSQVALRTFGQEKERAIYYIPLWSTLQMLAQSFISVGSVTVALIAAAIGLQLRDNWQTFDRNYFLAITTPVFIAVAWFEVINNHSQTHSHFTYRTESAAIAIVMTAAVLTLRPQPGIKDLWSKLRDIEFKWTTKPRARV